MVLVLSISQDGFIWQSCLLPEAQMTKAKTGTPRERVSTPHPMQETDDDGIMIDLRSGAMQGKKDGCEF
jgi:hypothetical protein